MNLSARHQRGLFAIACDQEASEHYRIGASGLLARLWRMRCYVRGVLGL